MSADKRKTILVVFAGVAVILVAVIVVVSPTFRSEDASGAIGAVQKHHQPQITKADVILGDEQVRHSQKVQYVDFLNDAAALRSMAENFKAASNARDAKSRFARVELGMRAQQKQTLDLVVIAIIAILIGDKDLATDSALGSHKLAMIAAADNLEATSRNFSLGKASVQDLSSALLGVRKQLDDAEAMESQRLRDAVAALDQKTNLESAKKNIAEAEAALNARNAASMARAEAAYAEAMAGESEVLGHAASALSSNDRDTLGLLVVIANKANDLETRAVANMQASLNNATEGYEALGRMKQVVDSFSTSANFSRESANLDNMRNQYGQRIHAESVAQLAMISSRLESADAGSLDARMRNSYEAQLDALSRLSGNAAYASMFQNADDFATQVKALSNVSLNAAKKNISSLDASKKNRGSLDASKK